MSLEFQAFDLLMCGKLKMNSFIEVSPVQRLLLLQLIVVMLKLGSALACKNN